MESIYWFGLAYIVGTVYGFWLGCNYDVATGVLQTVTMLIENGFLKTREDENGDLDLIKLTFEERLNDTTKTEDC